MSSLKKIYLLSLSEVHIKVELRLCTYRDEYVYVRIYVSVCVRTVLRKKIISRWNEICLIKN